jgi:hypothetical protein
MTGVPYNLTIRVCIVEVGTDQSMNEIYKNMCTGNGLNFLFYDVIDSTELLDRELE